MADFLNLGAGGQVMAPGPGDTVVNHDRVRHRPEIDAVWDLDDLPWPWADQSFDFIVARAVLEHLRLNLVESLDECWRILRPAGRIYLKLPYWDSEQAHRDPTHRWFLTLDSFDYFDPDTEYGSQYGFYTDRKWKIVKPARFNHARTSVLATLEVRK